MAFSKFLASNSAFTFAFLALSFMVKSIGLTFLRGLLGLLYGVLVVRKSPMVLYL